MAWPGGYGTSLGLESLVQLVFSVRSWSDHSLCLSSPSKMGVIMLLHPGDVEDRCNKDFEVIRYCGHGAVQVPKISGAREEICLDSSRAVLSVELHS